MKVPLLNLKAQYQSIKTELDAAIAEVVESQRFILGPQVRDCEEAIAKYAGCAHGVGVSSGTDALLITLMAEGIGPGDEVITTPYSFFATAGAIARVGARPVFVDIDPVTCNLDATRIQYKLSEKTKAIMPVHLFGQMADMDPIMEIAHKNELVVIEDAAQAIGAEYKGQRAGSIGHYGCFSFFPSKNLGCFGDGGMVVTNDPSRAEKLSLLRVHGARPKYHHKIIGGNFRLDTLQAAVIVAKLRHLDAWTATRQSNAARYDRLFEASGLISRGVQLPKIVASRHIFNQYVIRVPNRDALRKSLTDEGIATEVYYPISLHLQECFAYLGHGVGDYPEGETAAAETLALPVYPEMTDVQAKHVVTSLRKLMEGGR